MIEPSLGVDRLLLALLVNGYDEEELEGGDTRIVLRLDKRIAPIQVAVLPLAKKLSDEAEKVFYAISDQFVTEFDVTQSIGKRYRRQDEIGTPYCVTFDFDSLEDHSVTVRDRDSMSQDRILIEELPKYLAEKFQK